MERGEAGIMVQTIVKTIHVCLMLGLLCGQATVIPDLEYTVYVQKGDLNIGGLFFVQSFSPNEYCSALEDSPDVLHNIQLPEMMNFAIQQVNNRSDLLPNVTLGFVIVDSCFKDVTALAMSTFFVDVPRCDKDVVDQPRAPRRDRRSWDIEPPTGLFNESSVLPVVALADDSAVEKTWLNMSHSETHSANKSDPESAHDSCAESGTLNGSFSDSTPRLMMNGSQEWQHHKVVGVVGPGGSRESVMVSSFLGLYQIPTLATFATSDDLSDKSRYKYFSRLVPTDGHQVEMFMDLLQQHNWTYISLIYSEGSYGENAAKKTERSAEERDICIAYQKRIPSTSSGDEKVYNSIAKKLAVYGNARVIILFLQLQDVDPLFEALSRFGLLRHFLFLCGDFVAYLSQPVPALSGSIYATGVMEPVSGFKEFYGSLSPWKVPNNPWMRKAWADQFSCSWKLADSEQPNCNQFEQISDSPAFKDVTLMSSKAYEGVQVYALALHSLIAENCPEVFTGDKTYLDDCIKGPDLLSHLRRVDLTDEIRPVQFDSIGDLIPVFDMQQMFFAEDGSQWTEKLGRWYKASGFSTESDIQFNWMVGTDDFVNGAPESVCSKPCGPKLYAVQMELPCCWECRGCRDNEIINGTGCELCPEFTWPDDDTQTICHLIPVIYLRVFDKIGLGLFVLAALGIALSVVSGALFIHHRHHRLIKASSRELNFVTLCGLLMAFAGNLAFLSKPTAAVCWIRTFIFPVAVSVIFCPIVVKAVRVYRIFRAGSMGKRRPRFTASSLQVILTGILISVQVFLVITTNQSPQPSPGRHMPVLTKKYVELVCEHSLPGFLLPLIYNILIIVVCAMVGFLTRKLPENFNESWFSFISVATTLFMWMVFVPSYYNAFYAYHKAALLALCLILNAFVTTTCLFLSKIYAVLFVKEVNMKVVNTTATTTKLQLITVSPINPPLPSISTSCG